LFVRKFSATIDAEDQELVRSLGPWHVGKRIRLGRFLAPLKKKEGGAAADFVSATTPPGEGPTALGAVT
jgi:hypothetical protein